MLASVVSITDEPRTPQAREQQLVDHQSDVAHTLRTALQDAAPTLLGMFELLWRACCNLEAYWAHRATKAERDLRAMLGADLTPTQRARVLKTLYGEHGIRRDLLVISDHERQLLDHYRAMDGPAKQMLRTLCERLAATSANGGA